MQPPLIEHLSITRRPDGFECSLSAQASVETCLALLKWLPESFELTFYDPRHPSVSDPGAHVTVQRKGDVFSCRSANHGWSSGWSAQPREGVAAWMALNSASALPGRAGPATWWLRKQRGDLGP